MARISLSLTALLNRLISQAPRYEPAVQDEKAQKLTTTIRLNNAVRQYYGAQAENLGISLQETLALTLNAVMRASTEPQYSELENQVDRFFELFSAHGIAVTDIPELLGPNTVHREDLLSRGAVLNKLDGGVRSLLGDLFNVKDEWLKGLNAKAHVNTPALYKEAPAFCQYLAEKSSARRILRLYIAAKKSSAGSYIQNALKAAATKGNSIDPFGICIVVEEETVVNGHRFSAFKVLGQELRWNYCDIRIDIKAVLMFCDRTNIKTDGIILVDDKYEDLVAGRALAASILNGRKEIWHPDELVWNVEKNTELDELSAVERHYKQLKLGECEKLIRSF